MPTQFIAKRAGTGFIRSLPNASGVQIDANDLRVKYNPNGTIRSLLIDQSIGGTYYVDDDNGVDTYSGMDRAAAFKTMQKALNTVAPFDTIVLCSDIVENCEGPVSKKGVSIAGCGPMGQAPEFRTAVSTGLPVLRVMSEGWLIQNIRFRKSDDDAGISLYRSASAATGRANYAVIANCDFLQNHWGIEDDGGCVNVQIYDCFFHQLSGALNSGIICTSTAQAVPIHWVIKGNRFSAVLQQIAMSLTQSLIDGNYLEKNGVEGITATLMLSTKYQSSQGNYNAVVNNIFGGVAKSEVASTLFYSGASETWANNLCTDGPDAGVPA